MAKKKLQRFAEMFTFEHVVQPPYDEVFRKDYPLKGNWNHSFFKNDYPIILELGCGKGEYTIGLAQQNPKKNFLGIDIKGARMWCGAKTAQQEKLDNVGFLRTRVDFIASFFAPNEIEEIWITFPDPQPQKYYKRLTSTKFLRFYKNLLSPNGYIHLKTDNKALYLYTKEIIKVNKLELIVDTDNLYNSNVDDSVLAIKTFYEKKFIEKGQPIHYLKFKLNNTEDFEEPEQKK
ncbi:MAG TPA: tRNA (guanosine(46)-N7)-methyltransferase TrmB [Bacteroidales bacterium]|nr:tRNA (guanosine(46)-N7)-methyltransferase TrmB [Bacteroidales bacterium]